MDCGEEELHQHARWGEMWKVKELLDQGVDVETRGYSGQTPLHDAVYRGNLKIATMLIEDYDANVEATNDRDRTPLFFAAERGYLRLVRYLIEQHSANTKSSDFLDKTALHIACLEGHLRVATYLVEQNDGGLDAIDYLGRTPLHIASCFGHVDIVELLLDHGANIDAKTKYGSCTPLHVAASTSTCRGPPDVIRLLLSRGTNPVSATDSGDTPLHMASSKIMAQYLIEHAYCQRAETELTSKMFIVLNNKSETPLEAARNQLKKLHKEEKRTIVADLADYLDSFGSSRLAVPPDSSLPNKSEMSVKLNPNLDRFQSFLADGIHHVLDQTQINEVAITILGYLTPVDVINQAHMWRHNVSFHESGAADDDSIEYSC